MPQDAFTLNYICNELNNTFSNGKVNRITALDNDRVVFTIYNNNVTKKLLISVNPSCPRIGLTDSENTSLLTVPTFSLLLKKHLLSSTILDVGLIWYDRIVKIDFETNSEFTDKKILSLYVELMGRYSNIILTENGKILGANRVMFDNGVRPLLVGLKYTFPPTVNKLLPDDINLEKTLNGDYSAENISSKISGLANITAKEIVDTFDNKTVFQNHLLNVIKNSKIKPIIYIEKGVYKDFFVFPYRELLNKENSEIKTFSSLLEAEKEFFTVKETKDKFNKTFERLSSVVNNAIKKEKKKLFILLAREKEAENYEENKLKGELIVSNIYKIKRGDKSIKLLNYYDNTELEIALNENLTPSENSSAYFKKYNKQKRTLQMLLPQKKSEEDEIDYLTSVLDEISCAKTYEDLTFIKEELIDSKLITENTIKKKQVKELGKVYNYLGYTVRVGRNNAENDKLTFSAKEKDMWVHVKDYHSSHVIIEYKKEKIPESVIIFAGELSSYYSKAREGGKVEIVYTERHNVKKPPKSHLGFVTYTDFKSMLVNPSAHGEYLK